MSWFKADDGLHSHPKSRMAGLEAMGLWVTAGTYSAAYNLGGFVPDYFVTGWPRGRSLANRLVAAGLWDELPTGWAFHDWDDYQLTPAEVDRTREAARDRQRARRARLAEARSTGIRAVK